MSKRKELEEKQAREMRDLMYDLLDQCTDEQQAFFAKLFPKGVSDEKLANAIDLCERTITKNNRPTNK